MKTLSFFLVSIFFVSLADWETDFEKAKQTAQKEHKYVLLNFSGSDWCGPCIRLHKEVFEKETFKRMAESSLVLINADFPRMKKNQLTKELQKQNDHLADLYDAEGIFPVTVLLTPDGKVIKKWPGYPPVSPEEFIRQIKATIDAGK